MPPRDLTAARFCQESSVYILAREAPPFTLPTSKEYSTRALKRFNIVCAGFLVSETAADCHSSLESHRGVLCHIRGNSQPTCWEERSSR